MTDNEIDDQAFSVDLIPDLTTFNRGMADSARPLPQPEGEHVTIELPSLPLPPMTEDTL